MPSDKIWLNTVGTFGVTSASDHFTRLFAAVTRAHSLLARRDSCQLTYVDDLLFMANGLSVGRMGALAVSDLEESSKEGREQNGLVSKWMSHPASWG
jgi:hypothetical protein